MKKSLKIILIISVILIIPIVLISCSDAESNGEITDDETEDENIVYEELEVGDTAPDFTVELLGSDTVKLSDFKGKAVFLNFWATWCGPCIVEFPTIQQLADAFPDDLVVIAVNCSEKKTNIKKFIDDNGYDFNVGLDEDGKIQKKYPTMGIPYTVIIDPDGVITSIHLGADDKMFPIYEAAINETLGAK